jgi:ABC-type Mn2+/Zn2+ transport system ATPase subunit
MLKQISSVEHEEGLILRGIGKAEMLLRKINDAESIALQNTIDNINMDVEEYITNFFGENVSVKLQAFKESNKGKEIKPGINIIIMKDGESVDLDSMSGGEFDRVCLAFFLAFNKVSKSNIIMLDESLSSIHAEMVEDIVMYIKERLKDKLILFTLHQCNTGLFDKMIDVESLRSNND